MVFARRIVCLLALFAPISLPAFTQSTPQVAAIPSRLTARIDESQRVRLTGNVHPFALASRDRGTLADSTPLRRMQIILKRSGDQEKALQQRLQDLHRPGSSSFHQWLTPDSFGKEFGPSDADVAALSTWLSSKGFTGIKLAPGRQTLEFSGTAGSFRDTFHAEVHRFAAPDGTIHTAVASDPDIPAALAPVFGGFVSTSNFTPKPPHSRRGSVSYNPTTHEAQPDWTLSTNNFLLAPADFAVQYDLNPLYNSGLKGDGQTIAVINISNVNAYIVSNFRSLFSLPASPLQVVVDGDDPGVDGVNNPTGHNGWAGEAYLDVEWAGVAAPNAQVMLVTAGDTELSDGFSLAAMHAVYNNLAPVMSLSVEECEMQNGAAYNSFLSSLWEQAAAQGITVLVASSDSGSAGCDNFDTQSYAIYGQQVNGWASTPYNVAVGGTDFYYSGGSSQVANYWNTVTSGTPVVSLKSVVPEQPWNDTPFGLNLVTEASNGGTSIVAGSGGASNCGTSTPSGACAPYPKPTWQTGTGVPSDGARDLPDLSLFAANGSNRASYPACLEAGDCNPSASSGLLVSGVGGTSASTPAFAGIMALITQKYGRQGQANYVFYPLAAQFPAAFHDVTVGTNTVPCNLSTTSAGEKPTNCISSGLTLIGYDANGNSVSLGEVGSGTTADYRAGVGYDLASGLGSVDANVMIADWNKITFGTTTTTLTPSATSVTHGTAITLSGAVTNSISTKPSGQVAVMTTSTAVNSAGKTEYTLSNGAYSGSLSTLPGGTYTLYGRYGGDALNAPSTSTPVTLTITPESSSTVLQTLNKYTVVNNGATLAYGSPVSLDALSASPSQLSGFTSCLLNNLTCPAYAAATGTSTFADNGTALGTVALNANSEAGFIYSPAVGSHSVSASYSGDTSYGPSSSGTTTFTVGKETPVVYGYNNDYFQAGGSTTLTVFLDNALDTRASATPPSGTITLSGLPAGMATTATLVPGRDPNHGTSAGIATLVIPATATAKNYTASVSFPGDSNYNATTGSFTFTIFPEAGAYATTTTATTTGTATPGSSVAVNVTLTAPSGHGNPSEYLFLYSGGNLIDYYLLPGTSTTVAHTFYVSADELLGASNVLTVEYTGDGVFMPSSTTVTVSANESDFTLVPAKASLSTPAGTAATDSLNLTSSGGFAGAVNLSCTVTGSVTCSLSQPSVTLTSGGNASATLTLNSTGSSPAGVYNVVVTGSDSTGQFVHTAVIAVTVTSATSSSFSLSNSGNITIASQGASGSTGISVTPSGSFTGAVNLSCAVTSTPANATSIPTCSVTSPITVSLGSTASGTLTINTTAPTTGALLRQSTLWFAGSGLATLLLLLLPGRRRRWQSTALAFTLLLAGAVTLTGCGGGGSGNTGGGGTKTPTGGTTLGSYTVTVTATDAATSKITATTAVTVTVN